MPSPDIPTRKLVAIMFTDIAGYSAQMSKGESGATRLLKKKESVLKPLIEEHNGTYVKSTGDGTLSQFNSAVDAAKCAIRFQESLHDDNELNVRIGIHLGETIFDSGDIRGDEVNVASQLESMAVAGGIFVSKEVHDQLVNQKGFDGVSLGLQSLKGVGRLKEVFGLKGNKLNEPNPKHYQENKVEVHSDDEVPSLAIIPFDNKGVEEDAFYAYGISTDLISDVTSAGLIRVASKKQIEDVGVLHIDELAKKLLIRYVTTGDLWKIGDMFQLSVELYDTKRAKVLWSDRWQENWDNLSTIQDKLSDGLLKALDTKPRVEKKTETTNIEAYEYYLKGKYKHDKRENIEDTEIARGFLQKSIELDDNLLAAKRILGITYSDMGDHDKAMGILISTLKQAEELDNKHEIGHSLNKIGNIYYYKGDYEKALDYYTRSLGIFEELGDKLGVGHSLGRIGLIFCNKSNYNQALDYYTRSLEINEELSDKHGQGVSLHNIGIIYEHKGDLDKALDYYTRSLKIDEELGDKRGVGHSLNGIGVIYERKGDYDKALDYYTRSLEIYDDLSDKFGMGYSLQNIGSIYKGKGDYDKALDYYTRSLKIDEELDNKRELGTVFNNIGLIYSAKGDYDMALKYCSQSYEISEELGNQFGVGDSLHSIGIIYFNKGKYDKGIEYFEKSLVIRKKIGLGINDLLKTTTNLFLSYKRLDKKYDEKKIHKLIKKNDSIEYGLSYQLYQLLEDKSYLETALKLVQEKADKLDSKVRAQFLSYPVPKTIVEGWEKVEGKLGKYSSLGKDIGKTNGSKFKKVTKTESSDMPKAGISDKKHTASHDGKNDKIKRKTDHEAVTRTNIIKIQQRKNKALTLQVRNLKKYKMGHLTDADIEEIADSTRMKNGKINYTAIGRYLGLSKDTIKREIIRRKLYWLVYSD